MYLGNQPALSYTSFAKQDFTTSATTSYTLDNPVANANELALFINFVRQEPTTAYSASGTSLTLTSATSASDDMYCVYLGKAVQTVNPPNGSVGTAQLASDAVTEAKIADGAVENEHLNVNVITGQTAETSIATDDTILIHDTSASALRKMTRANFVSGVGGDLTPSWQASLPNTQVLVGDANTKINFSTEVWDTDSAYDTSNKRFTVPSGEAGKYMYYVTINHTYGESRKITLKLYKNGSKFHQSDRQTDSKGFTWVNYIDLSVSDYIEIYYYLHENPVSGVIDAGTDQSFFGGFKLLGV